MIMYWETLKTLSPGHFQRCTGVKLSTFELMVKAVEDHYHHCRVHPKRCRPCKLSIPDQLLLTLSYLREYRTFFHLGIDYGLSESTVCRIVRKMEDILIKDKRFHLPGKKALLGDAHQIEVVLMDVSESPIERPKKNSEIITRERKRNIR